MMTADMEDLKRRFSTIEKQFAELKGQMMGDGKPTVVVDNSTRTETTNNQTNQAGSIGTQAQTGNVTNGE